MMKNLKKLSRKELKSVEGGDIGGCGSYHPSEPPLPGEPFDCGCSNLLWCEKRGVCISRSMFSSQFCDV